MTDQPSYLATDNGFLPARQRQDGGKLAISDAIYDKPDTAARAAKRQLAEEAKQAEATRLTLMAAGFVICVVGLIVTFPILKELWAAILADAAH